VYEQKLEQYNFPLSTFHKFTGSTINQGGKTSFINNGKLDKS